MNCASCGRANPEIARFCAGCGRPLAPRCPACGAENEGDARFCIACGASLAARPAAAADKAIARKVVTVVFADLIGSVALLERLEPESARRVMDRYHRAMTAVIEGHGGTVVQLLGDGVLAAFGLPRVSEDDAIRAVRAGVGMQRAFRELVRELGAPLEGVGLRVAVNTGEVVVGEDETAVIGDPTNVAARLQHEARDGDVLLGEGTQRLVGELVTLAPAGTFALKGRSETVTAYRVVSLDRPAGGRTSAFVGRDEELRSLSAVYAAAVGTRSARLAVVLGSPGLGKSRLVAEFTRRAGERATVLTARCDAAGGATFAPLAEALRLFLGIEEGAGSDLLRAAVDAVVPGDEAERARITAGIGALFSGAPSSPEETFFAVRRLLAALAAVRPVVLVIDDLQWAEPLLFDLVEHLVQWSSGVPLFLLVAARPELRDARSSLATPGTLVADVITLGGLDAASSMQLAAGVVGAAELPAALVGRVLATSEGNPLFLGELVRMLVQDGTLARKRERWVTTVEVSKLDMPPTIQVLLAARIERLRPEDRVVLERAAVIGRQFSRAAVAHLLPRETGDLDARLEALRRSELVEPDTGWLLGEPALRFHHVLIRDAAYRRVLKETRAELHERLADWIIGRAGETVEHDETIGFHLEQAHQNLRELGSLDEHGHALGERATRYLAAAGRRALARDELLPAAGLLGRALDRLPAEDPGRAELMLDWCEALLSAGEVGAAAKAVEELARFAAEGVGSGIEEGRDRTPNSRLSAWHACFAGQLAVLTDPQALHASASAVAAAAEALAAAGDAAGEAKAHAVHALVLFQLGKIGACETALDKALAAARRAGERRRANAVLAGAPIAALWGPSPVARASGRCLDVVRVLRITQGAPAVEAVALRCQAVLETLRGRGAAARRMIASSRSLVEELGIIQHVLEADRFAGLIELLEGHAVAAEGWLRRAWDGLREHGLGIDAAQAGALLARALLAQDRIDEAETVSRESESLAGDSFKAAIAWRGVRAEVLAARGAHDHAIHVARAAVEVAAATDDLLDHADALASLAVALRSAGRGTAAEAEERRAIKLWEAKGASFLVERARRESPTSPRSAPELVETIVSPRPTLRRVPPNHATRSLARIEAAFAARDLEAVRRMLRETEVIDHPLGRSYLGDTLREVYGWTFERSAGVVFGIEPLAALGPSLALARWRESGVEVAGDDLPVGAYELAGFSVVEAHSEASLARLEIFADDRLGDAVVRLYARYAELLPEGPDRARAEATARTVAALPLAGAFDVDGYAAVFAPHIEAVDPRTVGFGSLRGADEVRRALRAFRGLTIDPAGNVEEVVGLRSDALLVRWTSSGTLRSGGGPFERPLLALWLFGADGRLTRWEQFDAERQGQARARFDALTAPRPAPARRVRPNAVTHFLERASAAIQAGDFDAMAALHADGIRGVHHPTGSVFDRAELLAWWRLFLRDRDSAFPFEPIAALGDSLMLYYQTWAGSGGGDQRFDVGPWQQDKLAVAEADAEGRAVWIEVFGKEHLSAAVTRLYERYAELLPEGRERERAAAIARSLSVCSGPIDPDRFAAVYAPSLRCVDHRVLGTWSSRDAAELVRHFRFQLDLAPDFTHRFDALLALEPAAVLVRETYSGTSRASGGAFENRVCVLFAFGADGLVTAIDVFEAEQEAEALARFEDLVGDTRSHPAPAASRAPFANAATRLNERFTRAWTAGDWDMVAALHAAEIEVEDRRRLMRMTGRAETNLAYLRFLFDVPRSAWTITPIATRGERLALSRYLFEGNAVEGGGPLAIDYLGVDQVGSDDRFVNVTLFDPDDLDAAYAELDRRYDAGEGAALGAVPTRFVQSVANRDWEALVALCAPTLVEHDHRHITGFGTTCGPEVWVEKNVRVWIELAPDIVCRSTHIRGRERAFLWQISLEGSRQGGPFEIAFAGVTELDAQRRIERIDIYDLDQLDEAWARYAAPSDPCAAGFHTRDPLRIPPNAATRAIDRLDERIEARDWDAVSALCAPIVFEDRRRLIRSRGGCERFVKHAKLLASMRRSPTLLATAGDRLALRRLYVPEGSNGPVRREAEILEINEVDAEGCITASIVFDADDRRAAVMEMAARFGRSDEARRIAAVAVESSRAMNTHDLPRFRATLADDFAMDDHRRTGLGRLGTPDEYAAAVAALFEAAPDITFEPLHFVAIEPHGVVVLQRTFGTLADGGGEFEQIYALLGLWNGDHLTGVEFFEPEDLELARARLAALRPEPT